MLARRAAFEDTTTPETSANCSVAAIVPQEPDLAATSVCRKTRRYS
jgi:hypothetical protein